MDPGIEPCSNSIGALTSIKEVWFLNRLAKLVEPMVLGMSGEYNKINLLDFKIISQQKTHIKVL